MSIRPSLIAHVTIFEGRERMDEEKTFRETLDGAHTERCELGPSQDGNIL